MGTRASIRFGDLSIDLEGEETFVAAQLERFSHLLKAGQPVSRKLDAEGDDGPTNEDAESPERKKTRKTRSAGGGGRGCTSRVKLLVTEQYFASPRTTSDVSDKLREKAAPYPKNAIAAALIHITKAGLLRRYKEGSEWLYINP